MQNPKEHTMIDTRLKVSLDELTLKSELSYLFYIEKLGLLRLRIGLLEFPAGILVQQASEVASMLRTNHDASSTRDTFLFIGLVRLIHVDGICRAHLYASMTGCTFLLTSFGMQGNWFSITIRTIAIHHQSTDGKHL